MHHLEYKSVANLLMLKKALVYLWAIAHIKNSRVCGSDSKKTGLLGEFDYLSIELAVFTVNVIYECALFLHAQCVSHKVEAVCECVDCEEDKPIGHTALIETKKYTIAETDFAKCSYANWSQLKYLSIKALWLSLLGWNLVETCWMNTYKAHLIFFFSYWGVLFTFISTALEILAAHNPKRYQAAAVLLSEMSLAFNLTITPMFWLVLAPSVFSVLSWSGYDLLCRIHYTSTHTLPIMTSFTNLAITKKFKLYPEDWRVIFVSCLGYIYCNYLGTIVEGEPMYPGYYTSWEAPYWAIFAYSMLAVANAAVFKLFACFWDRHYGY